MQFLLFQLGADRYAIEATRVAEVLPVLRIKALPDAPAGVAGLINYRGTPVPVVDLSAVALDRPSARSRSTRLVLVRTAADRLLALLAERATATIRLDPGAFAATGVRTAETAPFGPVATDRDGRLIQRLRLENLLPDAVRDALTLAATEAP